MAASSSISPVAARPLSDSSGTSKGNAIWAAELHAVRFFRHVRGRRHGRHVPRGRRRRGVELLGCLERRCAPGRTRRRRLRRRRWGRIDRLQPRNAGWIARARLRLRQRHAVTLEPAVDCRIFDLKRRADDRRLVSRPHLHVERARIEVDRLRSQRLRHAGADRTREAERRGVNGAEGRSDHVLAQALGDTGLPREQGGEVLISDRCRRESGAERAEPERRGERRACRPGTQRHHHPYARALQRDASPLKQKLPQWHECDTSVYSRIKLANALTAAARSCASRGSCRRVEHWMCGQSNVIGLCASVAVY